MSTTASLVPEISTHLDIFCESELDDRPLRVDFEGPVSSERPGGRYTPIASPALFIASTASAMLRRTVVSTSVQDPEDVNTIESTAALT
jgi:hypothetical protein